MAPAPMKTGPAAPRPETAAVTDLLARPLLVPSGAEDPVEKAAVNELVDGFGPEMFLVVRFRSAPDGVHIWFVWTAGGRPLGGRVDGTAVAAGMDAGDWLHIGERHVEYSERGGVSVQVYPLRPIMGDVQGGVRAPEKLRQRLRLGAAAAGEPPADRDPWVGFGPKLATAS